MLTRPAGWELLPVQFERDDAQRIQPALIGSRAGQSNPPANILPPLSAHSKPNNLSLRWIKPLQPLKRFIHPTDRIRCGWPPPKPFWLPSDQIRELRHHGGPGV